MFHRYVSILLVASLVASGGAVWASSVFVHISATNGNLAALPTGVSPTGGVLLQGYASSQSNYYEPYLYPAGTTGTMTDIGSGSIFTYNGSTLHRTIDSSMAENGTLTIGEVTTAQVGWIYSGGTAGTATGFKAINTAGGTAYDTQTHAINDNGVVAGAYRATSGGNPVSGFLYAGGTTYYLGPNATYRSGYGTCVTALNTAGQAVGYAYGGNPPGNFAAVWSYTISGSSISYTATDLQNAGLATAYPSVYSSQALAINSSGTVLVGDEQRLLIIYAPLRHRLFPLPDGPNRRRGVYVAGQPHDLRPLRVVALNYNGGHEQAINDSGAVVGYTGTQGSTWQAAHLAKRHDHRT